MVRFRVSSRGSYLVLFHSGWGASHTSLPPSSVSVPDPHFPLLPLLLSSLGMTGPADLIPPLTVGLTPPVAPPCLGLHNLLRVACYPGVGLRADVGLRLYQQSESNEVSTSRGQECDTSQRLKSTRSLQVSKDESQTSHPAYQSRFVIIWQESNISTLVLSSSRRPHRNLSHTHTCIKAVTWEQSHTWSLTLWTSYTGWIYTHALYMSEYIHSASRWPDLLWLQGT